MLGATHRGGGSSSSTVNAKRLMLFAQAAWRRRSCRRRRAGQLNATVCSRLADDFRLQPCGYVLWLKSTMVSPRSLWPGFVKPSQDTRGFSALSREASGAASLGTTRYRSALDQLSAMVASTLTGPKNGACENGCAAASKAPSEKINGNKVGSSSILVSLPLKRTELVIVLGRCRCVY